MNRGIITLVWGIAMSVMLVAFGVKAVEVPVIEETPTEKKEVFIDDYSLIKEAQAYLNEKGVNVPDDIRSECEAAGRMFDVSPELLEALAWKESRFVRTAENGVCKGIMQINTNCHAERLSVYGMDILSIHSQIYTAASLLSELAVDLGREGEPADAGAIIAAYHGENNPYKETPSNYTETVLRVSAALERAHGK